MRQLALLVLLFPALASAQITADGWTLINPIIRSTEAAAPATPAAGQVALYPKSGTPGEWCSKDDAGVETCMSAGSGGGGGGEANDGANLGGGLANYDSKSGLLIRFNTFAAADFDLASNLFTIDATKWLTIAAGNAAYQPLDSDLTSIAALSTTAFGRGLLTEVSASTMRSLLALVPGVDVQAYDLDLDDLADGSLSGGKVGSGINAANITTGTVPDAQVNGANESDEVTMGGDLSGAANNAQIGANTVGLAEFTPDPSADDQVLVSDSGAAATWRPLPTGCANATTSKVLYNDATNTWSCGTDQTGGGGGGGAGYAEIAAAVMAGF